MQTEDGDLATDIPDTSPTPEATAIQKDIQKILYDGINQLGDEHKKVIILRDLNGFSYEYIAKILKCSEGTVKSRISRARKRLKKILSENMELLRTTTTSMKGGNKMGKKSSISCDKYQDMIYNYFSDNLSEEQIEKLEDHISSCLLCKNEFEQIRALLSSAEQFEDQPLPVGFTTSLHTKLIEASEEIQDRRAHRFKYFCKDFITDGKWKVAAPAVVAVALLVGVFSSGLFQDFIHTNDDIVTDNIQTGQNDDRSNTFNDDFGLDRNSKETTSPRTTLRPKASASPTAKASSPKSTAKAT